MTTQGNVRTDPADTGLGTDDPESGHDSGSDSGPQPPRGLPPFHPPLLAAWSVLTVWAGNVTEVPRGDGLRLLAITVGAVLAAWLVLSLLARVVGVDRPVARGALATTIGAGALLLAGRVASGIEPSTGLVAIAIVALVGVVVAGVLGRSALTVLTTLLDVFTLVAVLLVAVPVAGSFMQSDSLPEADGEQAAAATGQLERDIYYIIPDRHPRADVAQDVYGIDMSDFQDHLEGLGFTIQDKARANYPKTAHSLSATWYMDYLPELIPEEPADPSSLSTLYQMLLRNPLGEVMTDAGADYVHIGNWWWPTASAATATTVFDADVPNEFTAVWRATTGLRFLVTTDADEGMERRFEQYELARSQLAELERVAALPHDRPRFVLVHVTIPHPPMVFDADGSYVEQSVVQSRTKAENNGNQVAFIDNWLQDFVDEVVTGDEATDPIIVIQSDEGPNPVEMDQGLEYSEIGTDGRREKLATFSAWYLPGIDEEPPEDITGVNTWRFILDHELGTDYGQLEDRVYIYPHNDNRYEFEDVTDEFE